MLKPVPAANYITEAGRRTVSTCSWEAFCEGKAVNAVGADSDIPSQDLEHAKESRGLVIERYQERDDLDKATQKLASEMPGNSKPPFLSLGLQVTIIKAAIRKMPAV